VLFLSNEATFDEFLDLSFDCLHNIRSESTLLLFDRLNIWLDVEVMYSHLRVEIWHFFITPSKDIYILLYQGCMVLLLWRWQAFSYRDKLRVCLITNIILNHFIFCRRVMLFKMFLPLKIQLLSPRVIVERLMVLFWFHLTGRGHVDEEFLEGNPHAYIRFPLRWIWRMW